MRTIGRVALVAILAAVALYAVGGFWTELAVHDDLQRFGGDRQALAERALHDASLGCGGSPLLQLWRRKLRLDSLEETGPVSGWPAYRAQVRVYGFFARPLGSYRVENGNVDCRLDGR
jgi:hypothetical protein